MDLDTTTYDQYDEQKSYPPPAQEGSDGMRTCTLLQEEFGTRFKVDVMGYLVPVKPILTAKTRKRRREGY